MQGKNNLNVIYAQAIPAQLIGGDTCAAFGIVAATSSPVLSLCRELVALGIDPAAPMHVYRGGTLCLRVRSIGEAAALEINSKGSGFKTLRPVRAGSPVRQNVPGHIKRPPGDEIARVVP